MKPAPIVILVFVLVMAVGCGDSGDVTGVEPTPALIELNYSTLALWAIGQEGRLEAKIFDSEGNPIEHASGLAWSVREGSQAVTVDDDGTVTALEDGEAQVVATVGEVSATVTVQVAATFTAGGCLSERTSESAGSSECATVSITTLK